jgi:subtilisin family serine protease
MWKNARTILASTLAAMALLGAPLAIAQDSPDALSALCIGEGDTSKCVSAALPVSRMQALQSWMSSDVGAAWAAGYKGKGTTITIVDDFKSSSRFYGNLGTGVLLQRHGEWTRLEASMIAPQATIKSQDFTAGTTVKLNTGLNVLNLSYGMFATAGYGVNQLQWSKQESSIISYAGSGKAVISKAAGNDAVAVNGVTSDGYQDYLNLALIGKQAAIFVGALDSNGTVSNKAELASYSNFAGDNLAVQSRFLTVGVEGDETGLHGTSFAAPIISGYAGILGSKFKKATSTQISNQLLNTARTDTVLNYDPSIYGKGEASLSRALAPLSIK